MGAAVLSAAQAVQTALEAEEDKDRPVPLEIHPELQVVPEIPVVPEEVVLMVKSQTAGMELLLFWDIHLIVTVVIGLCWKDIIQMKMVLLLSIMMEQALMMTVEHMFMEKIILTNLKKHSPSTEFKPILFIKNKT